MLKLNDVNKKLNEENENLILKTNSEKQNNEDNKKKIEN